MKEYHLLIVRSSNKKRFRLSKEEAFSLTSDTESVFCTVEIKTEKDSDVAVVDIPTVFV